MTEQYWSYRLEGIARQLDAVNMEINDLVSRAVQADDPEKEQAMLSALDALLQVMDHLGLKGGAMSVHRG